MKLKPVPRIELQPYTNLSHYERKVDFITSTDGKGFWNRVEKDVRIVRLDLVAAHPSKFFYYYSQGSFELRAYWDKRTWNVNKNGLIYTDKLWFTTFRKSLIDLGFSGKALRSVGYSEQGMQGDDYVSMDVVNDEGKLPVLANEYQNLFYSVKELFLGSLVKT
jgi:hypothetical protein